MSSLDSDVRRMLDVLDRLMEAAAHRKRQRKISKLEKQLAVALRKAFAVQLDAVLLALAPLADQFTPATEAGRLREAASPDWEPLFEQALLLTIQAFAEPLSEYVQMALAMGGETLLALFDIESAFDLAHPLAADYARLHSADLVAEINDFTRKRVRRIITQGVANGESYQDVAKSLRALYQGFTKPRPQEHIRDRATMIAVTEIGNAYEAGNEIVGKQLTQAGITLEHAWLTSNDSRVSDGCWANQQAGWIPFGQPFPSGHQRPLRHPGCRCTQLIRRVRDEEGKADVQQ